MNTTQNENSFSHKFGQNAEKKEKNISEKEKDKNNNQNTETGSNDHTGNKEDIESNQSFINDTAFSEVQEAMGRAEASYIKQKLINNHHINIPNEGFKKFVKWLALSTEVLKGNKNVVKYNMNTMTNKEAKATGEVVTLDQGTNVGENIQTRTWARVPMKYDRQGLLDNVSVGFPVVHEKIDELLVQRLTESIGKQSPVNGKVLDLKSIINANVLPVIKNGQLDYSHRILETTCQMLNTLNITPPTTGNVKGVLQYFTVEDLQYQDARNNLENLANSDRQIKTINLVLKSVNPRDMINELFASIRGALQLVDTSNCIIRAYGLHPLDLTGHITLAHKYDSSYRTQGRYQSNYKAIPLQWLFNNASGYQTWVTNDENGSFSVYTFSNSADRIAVENWLNDTGNFSYLANNTSVTINGTTYNYTKTSPTTTVTIADLCNKVHRDNYVAFENYADILNSIDLIAYLTSTWKYYGTSNQLQDTNLARVLNHVRMFTPSSIWGRIAMLYGQVKYLYNCERDLGSQTLLSNKVFNYSYYIAGARAKLAQNTYGSFSGVESHLPNLLYPSFMNSDRVVHFKYDDIDHYVPLLNYCDDNDKNNIITSYKPNSATGYLFAEYFTDPRWWRYDYFGNLKLEAPSQQLSANIDDQEYTASDGLVFTNVASVTSNVVADVGTVTYRFTANGQYVPTTIQTISYSPNTCLRLVIPNIFKQSKRVKCMLIHGLDLLYRANPVWYGYYDYIRTMVDDGSLESDILDELF